MAEKILVINGAEVRVYGDAAELARGAARLFGELAAERVREAGRFTVALSGGSTPRAMFELLASEPYAGEIGWHSVYFFWGDERCVPPDHPDSNYRMAREALLDKVGAPAENVFRMRGELEDPRRAAEEYSDAVREFFKARSPGDLSAGGLPRFDLVLLGMGADCHTASLFPRTEALRAGERVAVHNRVEELNADRLTLTAATINNARGVAFLVAGQEKSTALRNALRGHGGEDACPSRMIRPARGRLLWLVDSGAARLLEEG